MPRFVVLLHEMPAGHPRQTHFDLMLEHDGALRTWAMDKLPSVGDDATAQPLPNHRLAYLEYEGEVSGDRGRVSRVAAGEYDTTQETDITLIVRLRGERLNGTLTLTCDGDQTHLWRVSLSPG